MRVILKYEYSIKKEDGVGTCNDAVISAVRNMSKELKRASSSDDACNIFDAQIIEEE